MPSATIIISDHGVNTTRHVDLELPPEFAGVKYARLRTLEYNRFVSEAFTELLSTFNADKPLVNETFIMISFTGLPEPEPKKD